MREARGDCLPTPAHEIGPDGLCVQTQISLRQYTTLGLGGKAQYFVSASTDGEVQAALQFARLRSLPVVVLGQGSNTVFRDDGYAGLVLKVATRGHTFELGSGAVVHVSAQAGENWDDLVHDAVSRDLAGIECLSGIPGTVGATPVQNVGAYGQEVSDVIEHVTVMDRKTFAMHCIQAKDCEFRYRHSRFKDLDRDRFVITNVGFRLQRGGSASVRYSELATELTREVDQPPLATSPLVKVRHTVLRLRARKSMLLDPSDPNSRSAGSFFTNPVLDAATLERLRARYAASGLSGSVPTYPAAGGTKVPAAWLVEHAGFVKGQRSGGVGISSRHALALVNHDGTARELLAFADTIRQAVYDRFGVWLEQEPVVM